jgi:hypothetical protein
LAIPCPHRLQTYRTQGRRGDDAPKVAAILKKEGGGGSGRRKRAATTRPWLTGKITNKHLADRVLGEGVVSKTSVDQEEDSEDQR